MFLRYKIVYGPSRKRYKNSSHFCFQCLVAACLLLFSIGTKILWPEGTVMLQRYLLYAEETPAYFVDFWENRLP